MDLSGLFWIGICLRGYGSGLSHPFRNIILTALFLFRWDEGLLDMCIGEKRTLTIPPEYGYGDRGIGPIPGGATLVFETELVAIEGVDKDEL